jgi:type IV secretory pathway VirB10-like protein
MKKVVGLVVCFALAFSVYFAGCDEHSSKPAAANKPNEKSSVAKEVKAPVSEAKPQEVRKEVPPVKTPEVKKEAAAPKTQQVTKEAPAAKTPQVSEQVPAIKAPEAVKEPETPRTPDVIFVPTPQEVVEKMLELAQVKKEDLLYDLGCGDGRIVVTAAQKYGCKAIGYDIDPQRIKESLEKVAKNNVGNLVTIEQKDIFTLDLSKANVITLYLLPSLNVKLIPQLEKLKPGSHIVSHDFDMRGVEPDKVVEMSTSDGSQHTVYLWTTPLKKQ